MNDLNCEGNQMFTEKQIVVNDFIIPSRNSEASE